jgi:hypothetical protein
VARTRHREAATVDVRRAAVRIGRDVVEPLRGKDFPVAQASIRDANRRSTKSTSLKTIRTFAKIISERKAAVATRKIREHIDAAQVRKSKQQPKGLQESRW